MSASISIPRYQGAPVAITSRQAPLAPRGMKFFVEYCGAIREVAQTLFGTSCSAVFKGTTPKYAVFLLEMTSPKGPSPKNTMCRFALHQTPEKSWNFQSEIDTIEYIRRNALTIPVPTVYAYEVTGDLLGYPFLIMESVAQSNSIHNVFDTLTREQQRVVIQEYGKLLAALSSLWKSRIGALLKDTVTNEDTLTWPSSGRLNPFYGSMYSKPSAPGPKSFGSTKSWLLSIEQEADVSITMSLCAPKFDDDDDDQRDKELNEAHQILLHTQEAIKEMHHQQDLRFCLGLPYLSARDILIQTEYSPARAIGRIVCVLDFQGAGFYPVWAFGTTPPDFLYYTRDGKPRPESQKKLNDAWFRHTLQNSSLRDVVDLDYRRQQELLRAVAFHDWSDMSKRKEWILKYPTRLPTSPAVPQPIIYTPFAPLETALSRQTPDASSSSSRTLPPCNRSSGEAHLVRTPRSGYDTDAFSSSGRNKGKQSLQRQAPGPY